MWSSRQPFPRRPAAKDLVTCVSVEVSVEVAHPVALEAAQDRELIVIPPLAAVQAEAALGGAGEAPGLAIGELTPWGVEVSHQERGHRVLASQITMQRPVRADLDVAGLLGDRRVQVVQHERDLLADPGREEAFGPGDMGRRHHLEPGPRCREHAQPAPVGRGLAGQPLVHRAAHVRQALGLECQPPRLEGGGRDLLQAHDIPGVPGQRRCLLGLTRDPPGHVPGDQAHRGGGLPTSNLYRRTTPHERPDPPP